MKSRRQSRSLRPMVDILEDYCLLSQTGPLTSLAHAMAPIIRAQRDGGQAGVRQTRDFEVAPTKSPAGSVHAAATYVKGPVNLSGTYRTRFDDRLRFSYSTLSTFNVASINKVAQSLANKPLSGTKTHSTGDFHVTPAAGKSFLVMWNNVTAKRYDWLAVKYLGSGRFATLDRFGQSTNMNNSGVVFIRTYLTGGSKITMQFTNPSGPSTFANTVTYSLKFQNT